MMGWTCCKYFLGGGGIKWALKSAVDVLSFALLKKQETQMGCAYTHLSLSVHASVCCRELAESVPPDGGSTELSS